MRKLLFYIAAVLFIACSSTRDISNNNVNKEIASQFKIKKIKWFRNQFIIYATRNDSTFKIVSNIKHTSVSDSDEIRVGKYYSLDLEKYYPRDSLFGMSVMPNLGIKYVNYIEVEEKCHYSLYYAKNMNGLYIENSTE